METQRIQIKRRENTSNIRPAEILIDARVNLSSVFQYKAPLRGLTEEQEKKYLSQLLGKSASHQDFDEKCLEFWKDVTLRVPAAGVELDISETAEGEPYPSNLKDWIMFQWVKRHPLVANSAEEMYKDPTKQFYIYDPDAEVRRSEKEARLKVEAYKQFALLVEDEAKLRRVYRRLIGQDGSYLPKEQVMVAVHLHVNNSPQKFVAAVTDTNLDIKVLIAELVSADILNKIGNSLLYVEEVIGHTEDEAVMWFKNKHNSAQITEMRAKLQEYQRSRKVAA